MLCRLGHGKLECLCTSVIDEYGQTTAPANDYVCYFSVEFGKKQVTSNRNRTAHAVRF